jgi:hypothetical protein
MTARFLLALCFSSVSAISTVHAAQNDAPCETAAAHAERRFNIPAGLLQAISIVETGRSNGGEQAAWPWTINVDGRGRYFESRNEADQFVKRRAPLGQASMDIGCFQINTKWHGAKFSSTESMFDPDVTAEYAASFLSKLRDEFGSWEMAVENYHSRNKVLGERYGEKVTAILNDITSKEEPTSKPSTSPSPRPHFGGVELVIFTPLAPLFEDAGIQPIIVKKDASWN